MQANAYPTLPSSISPLFLDHVVGLLRAATRRRHCTNDPYHPVSFTVAQDVDVKVSYPTTTLKLFRLTAAFVPKPMKVYSFEYRQSGQSCSYRLLDITNGEMNATPVAFTERQWLRPVGESGPFCSAR
ncbi:MAG TPA: hypothetical protein VLJ57_13970 [Burkholderiaceae bacterium]|nr:hypothetical protein [Burkholderiaceae bacterium]